MEKTTKRYIDHYTCNAPNEKTLTKNGLKPVGDEYKKAPREYIRIPLSLLKRKRLFSEDPIVLYQNCERLMRDLK